MNELQTGIEFSFAVFPQAAIFLQPSKAAFDDPALGYDLKSVQLAALGDLHGNALAQRFTYSLSEGLACIATISQNALHALKLCLAAIERFQRTMTISDFGCGDSNRMRQTLRINGYVPLDTRYLFAGVIAFLFCRVRILHALRIDDQERTRNAASMAQTSLANLIFLTPALAD